jgi:hypothetical protein
MAYFKRVHVTCRQAAENETVEVNGVPELVRRGAWLVESERDGRIRIFSANAFRREFIWQDDT